MLGFTSRHFYSQIIFVCILALRLDVQKVDMMIQRKLQANAFDTNGDIPKIVNCHFHNHKKYKI